MTRQKDLKRLVRTRMKKTGEAYSTARANITSKTKTRKAATAPTTTAVITGTRAEDYATLAGMAASSVKEKTGRTWREWVQVLDAAHAWELPHRAIAQLVHEHGVADWWTQTVTVGYERIKGLRARGQRRDGTYEANKSRTFNVPVSTLFEAWADARIRKRWLNQAAIKVRTATAPKSLRLGWSDGSIIAVGFTAKGKQKSVVSLAHTRLRDRESADRLKQYWSERLEALSELLVRA